MVVEKNWSINRKYLDEWFEVILDAQDEQAKYLKQVYIAIQVIGVMVLMSAILAILGIRF